MKYTTPAHLYESESLAAGRKNQPRTRTNSATIGYDLHDSRIMDA